MEIKNMCEEKKEEKDFMHKVLKNLLDFHPLILSGISLVGMIYYFVYFVVKLEYFPDLGGADVAYVGVSIFFILAFISLSIILPCLFYPGYHKKDIGWIFFFGLTLLPFFTLVFAAALNYIDTNKIPFDIMPYSLGGSIIYLCLVILVDKKINTNKIVVYLIYNILNKTIVEDDKNNTNKIDILITFFIFFIFIIFIIIILLIIAQYFFKIEWAKLDTYFWFTMIGLSIATLSYFKGLEYFYKKNDYILPVMTISIMVIAILSYFILDMIVNRLGMTNVEFKNLSIEKSVAGALPEKICKNGKYYDDSKTYYDENETNGVVKLHNIKALSTLGKFYYLEAIGCEKDEKIRFELDASKIISREKQER
jgi:putative membrane protein